MSAAAAGLGLQIVGTGMSVIGSYNQAKTQKASLMYEAAVASNNAKMADYQGSQALLIGQQLEQNERLKTAQSIGSARTAMAANGIDLGEGTANDVLTTTTMMGERDALTIKDNAARQKWAYSVQAMNYRAEAQTDQAMSDSIDPTMAAVGSLLTGATGVASSYYNYKKNT